MPVEKKEEEEVPGLSYADLIKFIEVNHPVHPITKKSFKFTERVVVKNFMYKLLDPCNLNVLA